jgi:hypothetical protein
MPRLLGHFGEQIGWARLCGRGVRKKKGSGRQNRQNVSNQHGCLYRLSTRKVGEKL